jgi:surface protein
MKKEYGSPITVYKLNSTTTNLETGVKAASRDSVYVNRAVVLPNRLTRDVIQSISVISANKKVVQGGTFDVGTRTFIIDRRDVPGWEILQDDWLVYDDKRYDIKSIEEFEQSTAWLLVAREVERMVPAQDLRAGAQSLASFVDSVTYFMGRHLPVSLSDSLGLSDSADKNFDRVLSLSNFLGLADDTTDVNTKEATSSLNLSVVATGFTVGDIPVSANNSLSFTGNAGNELVANDFVSTWNTSESGTSNNLQITLPLESTGNYNFNIDWGDGNDNTITTWNEATVTHTYNSSGNYTLAISGILEGWRFNAGGDKNKLSNISSWGVLKVGNNGNYFHGCQKMTCNATDNLNLSSTTNLFSAFLGCYLLNGGVSGWDTSEVTNMKLAFGTCNVFNQSLNSWNTSNVIDMNAMFNSSGTFNQSLSSWNTHNVIDMGSMFNLASAFDQDLSTWNTINVTDMFSMFSSSPFNQDISSWNTSNVTAAYAMFTNASSFNQDISGWDTSGLSNLNNMFQNASSFDQDLGLWDISGVGIMNSIFNGTNLSTVNYSSILIDWDAQAVQNGVTFNAAPATYNVAGGVARSNLVSSDNWIITDGGAA